MSLIAWYKFDSNYKSTLIDYSQWKLGTSGTQGDFNRNGTAEENEIVTRVNPWGTEDIIWATLSNDAESNADGGWNNIGHSIDNTKKYRLSVWIRRDNIGDGRTYFGCEKDSVCNLGGTEPNGNPYFEVIDGTNWPVSAGEWVLWVAHIHPYDYTGTTNDSDTGIYTVDGTDVSPSGMTDFKWDSAATTGGHRTYLYYSTSTSEEQYWYRPRMEVCDGTEPSINDLLNGRENPNLYQVFDSSGNNNDGMVGEGCPSIVTGKIGQCYEFDGGINYVKIPDDGSFDLKYNFTLTAWIYANSLPSGQGNGRIISKDLSYMLHFWADTLYFDTWHSGTRDNATSYSNFPVGKWVFIVAIFNNGVKSLYISGELFDQDDIGSSVDSSNSNLTINGDWGSNYFNGKVDDVCVYNHILSEKEIKELSKAKILHYKFNRPNEILYDFEDGTLQGWVNDSGNFGVVSSPVYKGSYAVGESVDSETENIAHISPLELLNGRKISLFEFYWYETSSSYGGGIALEDNNGDEVVGVLTDNPEWIVNDGDGSFEEIYSGDSYEHWIYYRLGFDWSNGKYTYYFKDLDSGTVKTGTRNLIRSTNIATIRIKNTGPTTGDGWRSGNFHMWFDNIKILCESRVYDSSGYSNHGIIKNGLDYTESSMIGTGSYYFNNVLLDGSTYCFIQTYNSMLIPTEGTMTAWIKGTTSNQAGDNIYPFGYYKHCTLGPSSGTDDTRSGLITRVDGNNYTYNWGSQNLYDDNWHLYAVAWDDENVYLYIDGQEAGSPKSHGGDIKTGVWESFIVGSAWSSTYGGYTGNLDDIRTYNTKLKLEDIQQLYQQRASIDDKGNLYAHEFQEPVEHILIEEQTFNVSDNDYNVLTTITPYDVNVSDFEESDDTLGNSMLIGWIYCSSSTYLPATFEYQKLNNDQGIKVNISYYINTEAGWQYFQIPGSDFNYSSAANTPWYNMDRLQLYRTGPNTGTDTSQYITYKDVSLVKFLDNEEIKFSPYTSGVIRGLEFSEVGPTEGMCAYYPLDGHTKDYSEYTNRKSQGSPVGETGRVNLSTTVDSGEVQTISFNFSYKDPVVVAFIPTRGGGQSIDCRVRNVTSNNCEIFMQEPDNEGHNTETVCYIVIEKGIHNIDGLIVEAGSIDTSLVHAEGQSFSGESISFSYNFSSVPAVLHTLNTHNNNDFMSTTVYTTSTSGFEVIQEAGGSGKESTATTETIGWVAFQTGNGDILGTKYEIGVNNDGSGDGVDDSPHTISFSSFVYAPDVIVRENASGGNGCWARGSGSWTANQVEVYAEEDEVGDEERSHTDVTFAWAAFPPNTDLFHTKIYVERGCELDGVKDYIDISSNLWNDFFGSDAKYKTWTVCAWVNVSNLNKGYEDSTAGVVVGQSYGSNAVPLGIRENGALFICLDDTRASSPESTATITENVWYYITVVYSWDSDLSTTPYGIAQFYINGEDAGSDTNDNDAQCATSSELYIGRDSRYHMYLEGRVADVRIYNRGLSPEEIRILYDITNPNSKEKVKIVSNGTVYIQGGLDEVFV